MILDIRDNRKAIKNISNRFVLGIMVETVLETTEVQQPLLSDNDTVSKVVEGVMVTTESSELAKVDYTPGENLGDKVYFKRVYDEVNSRLASRIEKLLITIQTENEDYIYTEEEIEKLVLSKLKEDTGLVNGISEMTSASLSGDLVESILTGIKKSINQAKTKFKKAKADDKLKSEELSTEDDEVVEDEIVEDEIVEGDDEDGRKKKDDKDEELNESITFTTGMFDISNSTPADKAMMASSERVMTLTETIAANHSDIATNSFMLETIYIAELSYQIASILK